MDLGTALRLTVRHWVVAGLVLALTAAVAVGAGSRIDTEYEARATIIFLSPSTGYDSNGKPFRVNPFARAGTAERLAASTVLTVAKTEAFQREMERLGALGDFSFTPTSEVTVDVVSRSADPAMTIKTSRIAVRLLQEELVQRQRLARAPEDTWISAAPLASPDEPAALTGSRIRTVAGIVVIGLVATVSAAILVDTLAGRRTRGRRWWRTSSAVDGETLVSATPILVAAPSVAPQSTAAADGT
jgi:hypothetical protein